MYLKRLEIYGFKTFAEHTDLEFGPGITAIVGPNGSGKSNISDAILWVLGEQGMKSLRSAKSTDVIFNGSDSRKALGLAEVHLTLDNSSGMLPTDFTEVTITRRVFRSGDSEYLINRTPVRMRDVHNLFMDTGIGKQSYSIISQGEVDAVLSSRSEERRALFEEAAGISRFKQRKKEALRKLEQTRLNLLRVHDVIDELNAQIGPLGEQSEKARKYQVINEELTVLQLSLLVMQYTGLQSSLARAKEREAELQQELETLRHAVHQHEVKEVTLRAELQHLEDELEERRNVESRLMSAVQAAEGALALFKQEAATTTAEIDRLSKERTEWESQSGKFETEIATASAEVTRLQAMLTGLEGEIADADTILKEAAEAINGKTKAIQERRNQYLDILDQAARVRNELVRVESLLQTSAGRETRIGNEIADIATKIIERQTAMAAAQAEQEMRIAARMKLQAQRTEAVNGRNGLQEKISTLRREESATRETLAGLRSRRNTLQELEEGLEGYFPGVRAVITAATAGKLKGKFAVVSELLDVPAKLDTAIEVALGANLQDVVTNTEFAAKDAVNFLKQTRSGRATFLPLDLINPSPRADYQPQSGILGLAMDLVTFDAEFTLIAQHLLGRVIIAEDLEAALTLAKSNRARGWKSIVTLDGEVVTPARAISGGSTGKSSGLLKRKRELQELNEKIVAIELKAASLQKQYQETQADSARLDAEITSLAKESERAATAVAEVERLVATTHRDVASLDERRGILDKESKWLAGEVETAHAEEEKHKARLSELETGLQDAEAAVQAAEQELVAGQSEREGITEQYSALRVKLTAVRGELNAAVSAVNRATELHNSLGTRLKQNEKNAAEMQLKISALTVRSTEATTELERLRGAYQQGTGDLDTAKGRRTQLLETIGEILEAQKKGRESVEECQNRLHRSDLRITQVDTELNYLNNQLFDDYRLTPDQAIARAIPVENRGVAVVRLKELQAAIEELGTVNLGAIEEFERIHERLNFLTTQRGDLESGREGLQKLIKEIDATCIEKFLVAFNAIAKEFQDLFTRLFGGGRTELALCDAQDVLESGIDINVTIPGKRNQNLLQLSGGERALTALALLFAMLRVKPSPFVVLDEIDAPLDEANVGRYNDVLRDFCRDTQFLTITHNKGTMEAADVLYGVTMEKAGVSKIVSVRLTGHHHDQPALAGIMEQDGPFRDVPE